MTDKEKLEQLLIAIKNVLPYVVTQEVACHGLKCREPVCSSCSFDWEDNVENAIYYLTELQKAINGVQDE